MEINFEGRLRRTEQLVRPDGKKKAAAETASPAAQPAADKLSPSSLSQQTIETLREQSQRLMALVQEDRQSEKKPFIWDVLDGEEKTGNSEADALGEQMKAMERCHKIAARIMRGDKVPPEDERYLMENDPDGYKLALAMRKPKKHPKKWESVLKDEKKQASESGENMDTAACEGTGEASDSGGEAAADTGE